MYEKADNENKNNKMKTIFEIGENWTNTAQKNLYFTKADAYSLIINIKKFENWWSKYVLISYWWN